MSKGSDKILVLHPMIANMEEKWDYFAGVEDVEIVGLSEGPDVIHNREDIALAGVDTIRKVREAEKAGCKAVVLTCHGDPNLYAIREAVRIPVVGIMEVAMHFCAMLAHRFSILVPNLAIKRWQEENVIKYGFESKVASIRQVPFKVPLEDVLALSRRKPIPNEVIEPFVEEAVKAIQEDDAGAITFGCGGVRRLYDELRKRLREKGFEVPVVNPLPFGLDIARVLIKHELTQSSRCYPG